MKKRTGLIATKIGSSSYFSEDGNVIPVTLLKVDECIVSNIKTLEKDGYSSLQVISIDGVTDLKKVKKPQQKLFANIKSTPKKIIKMCEAFQRLSTDAKDPPCRVLLSCCLKDLEA